MPKSRVDLIAQIIVCFMLSIGFFIWQFSIVNFNCKKNDVNNGVCKISELKIIG
ncbi:MAG: hypothetical protein AB1782_06945 [Cyanobacteriota bacterium]